jgi:hypothetical protein
MERNYEKDCRIQEDALDVEFLEQPYLAIQYGRHWAHCQKLVNLAKENLEFIQAELTNKIAASPENYLGDVKPTVQTIEATVKTNKKYTEAKLKYIEAQYELNIAEIAKNEISYTRKTSLENLVKLFSLNYFAGPNVPRNISEQAEKRQKFSDSKISNKLKRKL